MLSFERAVSIFSSSVRARSWYALIVGALLLLACASPPPFYQSTLARSASAAQRPPGKVLFVLSAATQQELEDGKLRPTGTFLNEFYEAYSALRGTGYVVLAATPQGTKPSLDPESLNLKYWQHEPQQLAQAKSFFEISPVVQRPLSLKEAAARLHEFQALVVPGGQGLMVDLLGNQLLHGMLRRMNASDRPVGLICHAPAILTKMQGSLGSFAGRRITSVSGLEEFYIESFVMGSNAKVRDIGLALDVAGFQHTSAFPGSANAVRDCNLVTSQNPFSGAAFNKELLGALSDWRRGARCARVAEQ